MKYTNLKDSNEYREDLIKLIESGLGYDKNNSYKDDFNLLMEESNGENLHLLLSEDNKIVAHVGTRLVNLTNNSPILLLGGIVVNPTYEKKGHFKELFSKVINLYKDKVALMVLWSDLDGLYKKFNFFEAGEVVQTGSVHFNEEQLNKIGYQKEDLKNYIEDSNLMACQEHPFENKVFTVKREDKDWEKICGIKSASFYTLKEKEEIASYLFLGKGMDMPGIIHEVGFLNSEVQEKVLPLLHPSKLWIPFIEELLPSKEDSSFFLGIFRISNKELFKKLVNQISRGLIELIEITEDEVSYELNGAKAILGHQDFLNLILLPNDLIDPIPLWITGIDSI